MAKPPRESKTPGEMCSYNPKTGMYSDRWLWEEILGEDLSGPPLPARLVNSRNPTRHHILRSRRVTSPPS